MAKKSKFTGAPQDYLDWFTNLRYEEENRVCLPETCSEEMDRVNSLKTSRPTSPFQKYESGTSYATHFVEEHNKNYMKSVNLECQLPMKRRSPEASRTNDIECISSIAVTELEDRSVCTDLNADKAQVYLHYNFGNYDEQAQKLPVYNCKKEILKKIESFSVIVIEGGTGCGKSTQVPQYIMDDAAQNHRHVNIIVTQPRKIAAISLATRVCNERGWKVGKLVAYQVGLNNTRDLDTRLCYVTTEVLVQKAIHSKSLNEYTHIILDEVHERDQHTDFALLIVKKLLHTVSRHVKVILMSATIDCQKFAKYFSTPIDSNLIPAPIISISDRSVHIIQVYYLDSLRPAFVDGRMPPYSMEKPGINQSMFQFAMNIIVRFDDLERQQESISQNTLPTNRGAVLIFLPGLYEIETMINLLKIDAECEQWELMPLHSTLTIDEQRNVFSASKPGFRKIIVSTNIAESSITVPDIKYVIDFCLTKVLVCDPATNCTSLKLAWTSKASCTQRAGRAGRVSSGRVYRLVEEFFYDDLDAHPIPEMCRTPIEQVVLKIKQLDMGQPKALLALALDPPNLNEIHRTVLLLKQIGALGLKSGGSMSVADGNLTYLGRVAAALPLDVKCSKLIMMGYLFGCLKETVIIAAGLSLKSFHSSPFQDELNAFISKVSWAHGSFSDCLALYNTYTIWESFKLKGRFEPSGTLKEKEWARSSYVQLEALKEVDTLVTELNSRLERLGITKRHQISAPQIELQHFFVKMCIAGAFFPNYFKKFVPDEYEKTICRELSNHDMFSTVVVSGLPPETNLLYDDQLKRIFKNCSTNLNIIYEGCKAYIQFPKRNVQGHDGSKEHMREMPGECPTAMHLALKMRQIGRIRDTLTLHLLSSEEANMRLMAIVGDGENMCEFQKTRERTVQRLREELQPPVMPPPSKQRLKIFVTHVEDDGHFWIMINEGRYIEDMGLIQSLIVMDVRSRANPLPTEMVIQNCICLAPYTDPESGEECYYRGQIQEYVKHASGTVLVFFVDYGNSEKVEISRLRTLPEGLVKIPKLAIPCVLSEIKPISYVGADVENQWSKEGLNWLKRVIMNREFLAQIYSVVHNILRLRLYDRQQPNELNISINEVLISKHFALPAEEFFLSKQNHHLRAILSSEIRNSGKEGRYSQATSLSTYSLRSLPAGSNQSSTCRSIPRRLKGPNSPLEMNFTALTRVGCSKAVKIDPTSVNSTALDSEPQSLHERLMVAPFVHLNPSETHVILRHSTLMPAIPGLVALSLLMFSPFVEMRLNEQGSAYTGALVGLGYEPDTGVAIYPDDDMEVAFDFNFTRRDLHKINSLRCQMSSTLECYDEITPKDLLDVQKIMRELITEIMDNKRSYVAPETYNQPYKWNQVAKHLVLHPKTEVGIETNPNIVWPPHSGIDLQPQNKKKAIVSKLKKLRRLCAAMKAEKRPGYYTINEVCVICNTELATFDDLSLHLKMLSHTIKESNYYGI